MVAGILPSSAPPTRMVESEGILRLLLLVLALAMPLATLAFLKIQSTRLSYAMGEIKERIHKEEELQRKLMLERSRFQRDEEVQVYAQKAGLQPRKQGHVIQRAFTPEDQRIAKLRPVSSDGL
jgi:uncharacterized protein HemX